jgi:dimeric dUTPase (all-alpha-NTP-PPase superfamily)
MNLQKLFEMQRQLDERIIREKGLEGHDLFNFQIQALLTELGELSNEWQMFKHWKTNPHPKENILEEYVDGLHFILSIGLMIGYIDVSVKYPKAGAQHDIRLINERFIDVFKLAAMMAEDDYYTQLFQYYLDLGYMLGFTWEQIEEAYMKKNAVNHQRQNEGY